MIITDIEKLIIKSEDVLFFEMEDIIEKLTLEIDKTANALGVSAVQIGIYKKAFVIRNKNNLIYIVNPIIINQNNIMEFHNEGCLSFPGKYIKTKRYNNIHIKDDLHPNGIIATGLEAVILQHEIDHLYGKTMFDYEIKTLGRNEKCWCGSERKYKTCHLEKIIK